MENVEWNEGLTGPAYFSLRFRCAGSGESTIQKAFTRKRYIRKPGCCRWRSIVLANCFCVIASEKQFSTIGRFTIMITLLSLIMTVGGLRINCVTEELPSISFALSWKIINVTREPRELENSDLHETLLKNKWISLEIFNDDTKMILKPEATSSKIFEKIILLMWLNRVIFTNFYTTYFLIPRIILKIYRVKHITNGLTFQNLFKPQLKISTFIYCLLPFIRV